MNGTQLMMKVLLVSLAALTFAASANAGCTLNGTNGRWEGVFHNALTGSIGICVLEFKGRRLLDSSFCSDDNGDPVPVRNSSVTLSKSACTTQVSFTQQGYLVEMALTYDRAVTVATGIYFTQATQNGGSINLVKKG